MPPAVEARSPNHWTAREFPIMFLIHGGLSLVECTLCQNMNLCLFCSLEQHDTQRVPVKICWTAGWVNETILKPQFSRRDYNSTVLNKNNSKLGSRFSRQFENILLFQEIVAQRVDIFQKPYMEAPHERPTLGEMLKGKWENERRHSIDQETYVKLGTMCNKSSHVTVTQGQKHLREVCTAEWNRHITNSNWPWGLSALSFRWLLWIDYTCGRKGRFVFFLVLFSDYTNVLTIPDAMLLECLEFQFSFELVH